MLSQTVSGLAAQPLADGTGRGSGTPRPRTRGDAKTTRHHGLPTRRRTATTAIILTCLLTDDASALGRD